MKQVCFSVALLLFFSKTLSCQAQTATSTQDLIFFSVDKKEGIYRNFEEFRNNAPSIPYKGEVMESGHPDIVRIDFYEGEEYPCPKNTPIWGFCDGLTVFVSGTGKFRKRNMYTRLQYIGRYSYFQKQVSYSSPNQTGSFTKTYAYAIDSNTGKVFRLNKDVVLDILFKDEALTKKFKASHKTSEDVGVYLRLYSTNHPEEIK
jgi:hypothetical protein